MKNRMTEKSAGGPEGTRAPEIFRLIEAALAEKKSTVLVAIDGMCGSGKTTLGQALQEKYGCNLFHMDDFFLRPEQRTPERYAQPGGNVDYERFFEQVLTPLLAPEPKPFRYQLFECAGLRLGGFLDVEPNRLNIIEGAYSQHPYFGNIYDLRLFLEVSSEEQLRRIRLRNGEEKLKRFQAEWIPMENRYFDAFGIREKSVRVDNTRPLMLK